MRFGRRASCFPNSFNTVQTLSPCERYRPAGWRLWPDLDQNEAHALQVLNVLLEEIAGHFQHPGFFLQSAGQHVGRVGAVAAVPPRRAGVVGAVAFLQDQTSPLDWSTREDRVLQLHGEPVRRWWRSKLTLRNLAVNILILTLSGYGYYVAMAIQAWVWKVDKKWISVAIICYLYNTNMITIYGPYFHWRLDKLLLLDLLAE